MQNKRHNRQPIWLLLLLHPTTFIMRGDLVDIITFYGLKTPFPASPPTSPMSNNLLMHTNYLLIRAEEMAISYGHLPLKKSPPPNIIKLIHAATFKIRWEKLAMKIPLPKSVFICDSKPPPQILVYTCRYI